MADNYRQHRDRSQQGYDGERNYQSEQFESGRQGQFDGGRGYDASSNRSGSAFPRDSGQSRAQEANRSWRDDTSRSGRGYYDPVADYDQASQDYSRGRTADTTHDYFRPDDFGGGGRVGPDYASGPYGGGAMGGSNYARGGYSQYRGSEQNRDDDRGFFERAGDKVAEWFGDDDSDRSRESHRGRGPAQYKRSDQRILEDVCDHLTDDHHVDASAITVSVEEGEVTLSGTVPNRLHKRRAEDCVERISGVGHVQNNLRTDTKRAGVHDGEKPSTSLI